MQAPFDITRDRSRGEIYKRAKVLFTFLLFTRRYEEGVKVCRIEWHICGRALECVRTRTYRCLFWCGYCGQSPPFPIRICIFQLYDVSFCFEHLFCVVCLSSYSFFMAIRHQRVSFCDERIRRFVCDCHYITILKV